MNKKLKMIVFIFVILFLPLVFWGYSSLTDFSTEKWTNNKYVRNFIFESFLKKYNLSAMSKNDVSAVLGKQSELRFLFFSRLGGKRGFDYDLSKDNVLVYFFDNSDKEIFSEKYLLFEFDDFGNFKKYELVAGIT